jgi:hypothetical protein
MLYSQDCSEDPAQLAAVRAHVVAQLSSMASATDSETEYASKVEVKIGFLFDQDARVSDEVRVTGYLDEPVRSKYMQARSAAKPFAVQIQERLTAAGVRWRVLDGAHGRGNGQAWGQIEGLLVHHTATRAGQAPSILIDGRPDLSGPLCNSAGEADGTIAFVAYYPANHAGASGGRSMGPLPTTRLFNSRVWGHEIVYPGTSPMTDEQYQSAVVLGRVVSDLLGGNSERVRAHAETSITGKWDPGYAPNKTIDMAALRAAVKGATQEAKDLDANDKRMLQVVYDQITGNNFKGWPAWPGGTTNPDGSPANWTLVDYMRGVDVTTRKILAGAASGGADAKQIATILGPLVAEAVRDALGKGNDNLAEDIINRLGAKLAS